MIYIDIHRQILSKNRANMCRFVLSPWGNYRELTVCYKCRFECISPTSVSYFKYAY